MSEETKILVGKTQLTTPSSSRKRISMMLWGPSGSGKTTLASTAPGPKKLWINFDQDGTDVLSNRDDIFLLDFANQPDNIVMQFRKADGGLCLAIDKLLTEHEDIKTVVFDSLTTYGDKALQHGVVEAQGTAKGKQSTIEDPGYSGYGNKNTWTNLLVKNLLQVTGKHDRHVIFLAHEDKPERDRSGVVLYISIMLGSSLNEQLPVKLSEIWHLYDTGEERRISIRACRGRKPMKTRMFQTSGEPEFIWDYDAETLEGEGIETWFNQWLKAEGGKIPLPT